MKSLALLLLATTLQAATFYVSSAGNDSNDGSQGSPWATLDHATHSVTGGDIIDIVANGNLVPGDTTLPFLNSPYPVIIQSSLFSSFWPDGFRTNPAIDCADLSHCLYGRLQLSTTGINYTAESHGSNISEYGNCGIASISSSVITLGTCTQLPNLGNGSQLEIEIDTVNAHPNESLASALPIGLTALVHNYVVNCSSSPACGSTGSTLQLSATAGGSPITIGACLSGNGCYMLGNGGTTSVFAVSEPLQFIAGSSIITSPDVFGALITNGTPVTLSAAGMQLFGSLPPEFSLETIYYVQNIFGRTFKLSTDRAGLNIIVPSSVGVGPSILSNANAAHDWKFRGLEVYSNVSGLTMMLLGSGGETSARAMVKGMEIGHSYFHDDPVAASGPVRAIAENGVWINIHDNYIAGMRTGEAQAIACWGSPGPTIVANNFLEASTEITLCGGNGNNSGSSNANKWFLGNYYYKPPTWKIHASVGAPTVGVDPCYYDTTDPIRAGGEWHTDTGGGGLKYRCGSDGFWHTTGLTVPAAYTIKNSFEFKSGKDMRIIGNVTNYSWANNQTGQCYALHQNYDSGPGAANSNITIMHNKCLNVFYFVSAQSLCGGSTAFPCLAADGSSNAAKVHTIANNIVVENKISCGVIIGGAQSDCGFNLLPNQWSGGTPEVGEQFINNTVVAPDSGLVPSNPVAFFYGAAVAGVPNGPPSDAWTYKNNILPYDFQGDSLNGGGMIATYFTNSKFTNNVLVNSNVGISYASPGATNSFCTLGTCFARPANNAAMLYANLAANDLHLTSASAYSAANGAHTVLNDDGTDLGANVDLTNMVSSGAVAGTPPWDVMSGIQCSTGSTIVVCRFVALPGAAGVYTMSVYNSIVQIPANLVTAVADSVASAISVGPQREIPLPGLTAATPYTFRLVGAGSNVVIVGKFTTRPAGSGSYPFPISYGATGSVTSCTDRGMTTSCVPVTAPAPVLVASNTTRYYKQTGADNSTVSLLVAP